MAKRASNRGATVYETETGSQVVLKPATTRDDAVAGTDPGCAVREVIWGVSSTADLKAIAKARPEDCVQALCGGALATGHKAPQGVSAAKPDRQRGLDQLAYAPDVPENLRTALKQVLFAQVKIPFTDGYR